MSDPAGRPAQQVGRVTRVLDTAALLLLVSGAALYVYAQYRTGRIAAGDMPHGSLAGAGGGWNVEAVDRLARLSRIAVGVASGGLLLGLAAFIRHTILRHPAPIHEQADDSRSS